VPLGLPEAPDGVPALLAPEPEGLPVLLAPEPEAWPILPPESLGCGLPLPPVGAPEDMVEPLSEPLEDTLAS